MNRQGNAGWPARQFVKDNWDQVQKQKITQGANANKKEGRKRRRKEERSGIVIIIISISSSSIELEKKESKKARFLGSLSGGRVVGGWHGKSKINKRDRENEKKKW